MIVILKFFLYMRTMERYGADIDAAGTEKVGEKVIQKKVQSESEEEESDVWDSEAKAWRRPVRAQVCDTPVDATPIPKASRSRERKKKDARDHTETTRKPDSQLNSQTSTHQPPRKIPFSERRLSKAQSELSK